LVLALETVVM